MHWSLIRVGFVVVVLGLLAGLAAPAQAGDCGYSYGYSSYSSSYAAPHYYYEKQYYYPPEKKVIVSEVLPVALFQYMVPQLTATTPMATLQPYPAAPQAAMPQAPVQAPVQAPAAPPSCTTGQCASKSMLTDDQVRMLAVELAKALRPAPAEQPQGSSTRPPAAQPAPIPLPAQPLEPGTKKPGQVRAEPATPSPQFLTAYHQAAAVAATHCMRCHTGAGSDGDIRLFNDNGLFDPNVSFQTLARVVESERMPKSNPKCSAPEKAVFQQLAQLAALARKD